MSNATVDPIIEKSFQRLLNEYAPLSRIRFGRSRPARRQQAKRPRRMSSAEAGGRLKLKYATIIANFRKQRMIKTKRSTSQVNRVSIGQKIVAKDKKSLPGLVGILDTEILSELTDEDATLRLMKVAKRNRGYVGFARIYPYIMASWNSAAVVDGSITIDDRIAIPSCLQRIVLSRLHQSHPGQEATVDTAQCLWWPRTPRDIVNLCKNCRECTKLDKNLKPMSPFKMYKSLTPLNAPNEELQLDHAGPLSSGAGNQVCFLLAIDRFSRYPSAKLTKTTGANKILKFLENYIFTHSIPKTIRTDQYSGFKISP